MIGMSEQVFRDRAMRLPVVVKGNEEDPRYVWWRRRVAMQNHFRNSNLSDIIRWSTINATMFAGERALIHHELNELQSMPEWDELRHTALLESDFGAPRRMKHQRYTSGNIVHQTYHLMQWQNVTGRRINEAANIVEFGGGYGAMCAVVRRMGFVGDYYIYDFPEFSLVQEYYLSNLDFDVTCISTDKMYKLKGYLPDRVDLLIALHSLSESPIDERMRFLDSFTPVSSLFTYQPAWRWLNIDNVEWFKKYAESKKDYTHIIFNHKYLPKMRYLIMEMKSTYV
jgi:hypothetical protein